MTVGGVRSLRVSIRVGRSHPAPAAPVEGVEARVPGSGNCCARFQCLQGGGPGWQVLCPSWGGARARPSTGLSGRGRHCSGGARAPSGRGASGQGGEG